MGQKIDITKLPKYGRLTILGDNIEKTLSNKYNFRYVDVLCDCGNTNTASLSSIRSKHTKSCGCIGREKIIKASTTHGETKKNLYKRWKNIRQRCSNPKNPQWGNYGGRGIIICDDWKNDYTKFRDWALANGYKKELQIDRIDNNGNYEPNNCRWVTATQNGNNKRTNYFITYMGDKKTITEWSRITGIHRDTLDHRIQKGWSIKKAFETPKMKNQFG